MSAVKKAIRTATAGADAPLRSAVETALSTAKPIKQARRAILTEKMLTPAGV
jgi:hypothetical protein